MESYSSRPQMLFSFETGDDYGKDADGRCIQDQGCAAENGHANSDDGPPTAAEDDREVLASSCSNSIHEALLALQSSRDVYALEVSRLKELRNALLLKQSLMREGDSDADVCSEKMCRSWPFLMDKLARERNMLREQLQAQQSACIDLQRQLEHESEEKIEAMSCFNIMNDTVEAALTGERFLIKQNKHLLANQQAIAAKVEASAKRTTGSVVDKATHKEQLFNKMCVHGARVCLQLILVCHAMVVFFARLFEERNTIAPT